MRLAILLLLTVAGVHYLADPLATAYANQVAAAKAWEYILTNAGDCVLLLGIGLLARKPMVWLVVGWGIFESSQRVVCRLDKPIGGEPPVADLFQGLCGNGWYTLGLMAAAGLAVHILDKGTKNGAA